MIRLLPRSPLFPYTTLFRSQQGAEVVERANAQVARAPADGVFPRDFYVTTNQQTFICFDGKEIEVRPAMINSAIALDRKRSEDTRLNSSHTVISYAVFCLKK